VACRHRLNHTLIAAPGLWPGAGQVSRMCAQRRTSLLPGEAESHTVGKAMTSQQGGGRQPAGIRDVARLAGVSVASVSFALNGQPGVADGTRRRILAVAAELGYRANPQAQALRRGRTTTYGLVIRSFSNPFFFEVLTGAERAASEAGATLLLLDSHFSAEREQMLVREMAAQRLAGLAIAPVGPGESLRLWQELRPGTPAVALNAAAEGIRGVSRVRPDNAAAVGLAMGRLAELGHACVALLCAPRGLVADPDRLRHFRRLTRDLGVQPVACARPSPSPTCARRPGRCWPARRAHGRHHQLRPHRARRLPGRPRPVPADRSRRLGRRARRPADLGTARPAAGHDPPGRQGDGAGPDGAAARRRRARRLRRPGGTDRTRLPAGTPVT
jgi:hypothetical protein